LLSREPPMSSRMSLRRRFAVAISGFLPLFLFVFNPAAVAQIAPSPPDTPVSADVNVALSRMGKALRADHFSFRSASLRAYAGPNGELLHIAHNSTFVVRRPDRLLVDVTGDDGEAKMYYDGKVLVIFSADRRQYVSIPVPDKLDEMLDAAETRLGLDLPLVDFLSSDPHKSLLDGVTSGGKVGTAIIDGVNCQHFFFVQSDLDLELWLEDNDRALPRRLVVTYQALPGRPRFMAELSNWDFSTPHPDQEFAFQPPAGVVQVELAARKKMSPPSPAR
jgi:hypothetical protein